jgi:hypothetical protein
MRTDDQCLRNLKTDPVFQRRLLQIAMESRAALSLERGRPVDRTPLARPDQRIGEPGERPTLSARINLIGHLPTRDYYSTIKSLGQWVL